MRRFVRTALLTSALVSVPALAFAGGKQSAPAAGKRDRLIAAFDANGNGKLDRDERKAVRQARRARLLQRFDANDDGKLDRSERRGARKARLDAWFVRVDANGDGAITRDELGRAQRTAQAPARWRHHGKKFKGKCGGTKHKHK